MRWLILVFVPLFAVAPACGIFPNDQFNVETCRLEVEAQYMRDMEGCDKRCKTLPESEQDVCWNLCERSVGEILENELKECRK